MQLKILPKSNYDDYLHMDELRNFDEFNERDDSRNQIQCLKLDW